MTRTGHATPERPETDTRRPDDWELVRRIQRGDREAGEQLCRRYGPRVTLLVRNSLGHRLHAKLETEDLVQSSFVKVFELLPDLTFRDEASFVNWLSAIVENKIRSAARHWAARKRAADREVPLALEGIASPGLSPSKVAGQREDCRALFLAIERLPEPTRRIIVERMILGLPWETIEAAHGTPLPALQMRLSRAKRKLARELRYLAER